MNIQFPVQQCQYCGSTNIGLGWQHGTYHCWILANFDGGWYYVDSLYVRSAKMTAAEMEKKGYQWDKDAYPS